MSKKEGGTGTFDGMKRRDFLTAAGGTAAAGGLGAVTMKKTLAANQGEEVTVIEFDYHNAHVHSSDLFSLCYGVGYMQAWHRLFQIDVLRMMARGKSTEMLGSDGDLNQDATVVRDLYSDAEIEQMWQNAPDEMKTMLEGFAGGVNLAIDEMTDEWDIYPSDGDLPGEYGEIRDPPCWKPQDSVAIMAFLLSQFGVGGGSELSNAQTLDVLWRNIGSLEEAYNAYGDINWLRTPEEHNASIDSSEKVIEGGEEVPPFSDVPSEQFDYVEAASGAEAWGIDCSAHGDLGICDLNEADSTASNALLIDGQHTDTGNPIMWGAPQMGTFSPPVIYEVGMHGAGYNATGAVVAGTPGFVVGRTDDFSWTATSARQDHTDIIAVDLDPDDDTVYEWNGEWHTMETDTVVHRDDSGNVLLEQDIARINEGGHTMPVIAINPDARVAWAKKVTTRYDEIQGGYEWTQVARQDSRSGFEDQVDKFPFSFNFLYADDSDIAMYSAGKVPEERVGSWDWRLPVPGDQHEWNGYLVGLDMGLKVVNPDSGIITNWNNAPTVGWRAGDSENQWGSVHRNDYLNSIPDWYSDPISLADVEEMNWYSASWGTVQRFSAPRLVQGARTSSDSTVNDMADYLEEWGEKYNYDLNDWEYDGIYWDPGVDIWEKVRKELQDLIFRQGDLGSETPDLVFEPPQSSDPHAADLGRTTGANLEVTFNDILNGNTNHDWLNGRNLDDVIVQAFENAAETLTNKYGTSDVSQWLREIHWNEFQSIGWQDSPRIAMQNRGSYVFHNARGQGLSGAKHVLPPSNTGYVTDGEIAWAWLNGEPDRVTEQLDLYDRPFEYKLMPVTDAEQETYYDSEGENWFDFNPANYTEDVSCSGHPHNP